MLSAGPDLIVLLIDFQHSFLFTTVDYHTAAGSGPSIMYLTPLSLILTNVTIANNVITCMCISLISVDFCTDKASIGTSNILPALVYTSQVYEETGHPLPICNLEFYNNILSYFFIS